MSLTRRWIRCHDGGTFHSVSSTHPRLQRRSASEVTRNSRKLRDLVIWGLQSSVMNLLILNVMLICERIQEKKLRKDRLVLIELFFEENHVTEVSLTSQNMLIQRLPFI